MDSIQDRTASGCREVETARLERSVAAALDLIAAAQDERTTPPIQAARRNLAAAYGIQRLRRHRERVSASHQLSA